MLQAIKEETQLGCTKVVKEQYVRELKEKEQKANFIKHKILELYKGYYT